MVNLKSPPFGAGAIERMIEMKEFWICRHEELIPRDEAEEMELQEIVDECIETDDGELVWGTDDLDFCWKTMEKRGFYSLIYDDGENVRATIYTIDCGVSDCGFLQVEETIRTKARDYRGCEF